MESPSVSTAPPSRTYPQMMTHISVPLGECHEKFKNVPTTDILARNYFLEVLTKAFQELGNLAEKYDQASNNNGSLVGLTSYLEEYEVFAEAIRHHTHHGYNSTPSEAIYLAFVIFERYVHQSGIFNHLITWSAADDAEFTAITRKVVVALFDFIERTQQLLTLFTGADGLKMIKAQIIEHAKNSAMDVGVAFDPVDGLLLALLSES